MRPEHYGGEEHPHETRKCLKAWGLNEEVNKWNACKYISRAGKKDGNGEIKELNKAITYLKFRIDEIEAKKAEEELEFSRLHDEAKKTIREHDMACANCHGSPAGNTCRACGRQPG